ncbi:Kinesin-like protein KIF27 [Holothuria leucospilota]|uniref:Kinesin-like protein KIF27 n=1 Tax=Holothuria leucospilota TaxID=206669 RepID=A0A9Q1HL00_HOLLE|nr:Kinesin-like protein KIF27 [Holothuria leucospilota]
MQEVPVRVAVRVRPLLPHEKLHHHEPCVKVLSKANQIVVGKDRTFTFDHVLSGKTSQESVYKTCVDALICSFFEGYNATIFAYGQTGSGKTFTIGGHNIATLSEDEYGILPRAISQVFQKMMENPSREFSLRASYIEIYKEELKDLLDLETSSKDLNIREDEKGNTGEEAFRKDRGIMINSSTPVKDFDPLLLHFCQGHPVSYHPLDCGHPLTHFLGRLIIPNTYTRCCEQPLALLHRTM